VNKLTVVNDYLAENQILPAQSSAVFDTAMCTYAYWDEQGNPWKMPDSADLAGVFARYRNLTSAIRIDAQLHELRKKAKVTIEKTDVHDNLNDDPAALIAHADSARDTGNSGEAEATYRRLVSSFSFSHEGIRAYSEIAKILTERQKYPEAIQYYRDYLVLSSDTTKRYNTFFMIGFIYDEYLNKPELAELNYQWILKQAPKCDLADDAEFMCLHLGEAMNSVEELRDEAARQGKKADEAKPLQ
jgi:tetratricopeptide (TPR) repeat protein